jgi:hypothetical protein
MIGRRNIVGSEVCYIIVRRIRGANHSIEFEERRIGDLRTGPRSPKRKGCERIGDENKFERTRTEKGRHAALYCLPLVDETPGWPFIA